MDVPEWWSLLLLSGAAWRTFQLLARDDILDRPRRWALRLGDDWRRAGDRVPKDYREKWADFLVCRYCAGFWVFAAWWLSWQLVSEPWTEVVASLFVGSAALVALDKMLSSEE